ncbi:unnamed protein product [Arctia plantaginis]|uniref:Uncharacterized protein n=1 Tax=Arctia plantaginis TaxID=874455 RepID=A0A8S1AVX5_ARCPL|nr:unnamed protein product [Arctia plantaginis]
MQQILDVRTHSLALTLARLNAATAMQQILDVRTHSLALTLARLNAATAMQQILDVRTHSLALTLARLNAATAMQQILDSPLAVVFLTGDSAFLSNWDLYLITALLGALGLVVYLRRPTQQAAN